MEKGKTEHTIYINKSIKQIIKTNSPIAALTLNSSLLLKIGKSLEVIFQGAKW